MSNWKPWKYRRGAAGTLIQLRRAVDEIVRSRADFGLRATSRPFLDRYVKLVYTTTHRPYYDWRTDRLFARYGHTWRVGGLKEGPTDDTDLLTYFEILLNDLPTSVKSRKWLADEIADRLEVLGLPYLLTELDGDYYQFVAHRSTVLDPLLQYEIPLPADDEQLPRLLSAAVDGFLDAKADRRLEGLRSLAQAFERVKTLLPGDKKEASEALAGTIAGLSGLSSEVEGIMRSYTTFVNAANVRHSETSTIEIDGAPNLIEYVFYSLFSLVRAALIGLAEVRVVSARG